MKYIYLHGFASGPKSGKATFFRSRLATAGIELHIPDLAEESFENLTISGQLRVIEREAASEHQAVLIGSSLGGYLAAIYASLHPDSVAKVILLAPAFWFAHRWPEKLGAQAVADWEQTGFREFFHYGFLRTMKVRWDLMADGRLHPGAPDFHQRALIFHGTSDDVVPAAFSQEFASGRPNVTLRLLPSDHQLSDQVELIWSESRAFLGV
ncbi:MAG: YqiA/YcfP family alpha/beta fold hydrolase [Bryobacteraceae bacterium]|nr:YqiA/YcfP family alpha/beta fold hydrolase [Bryobacteraceae bacterium]